MVGKLIVNGTEISHIIGFQKVRSIHFQIDEIFFDGTFQMEYSVRYLEFTDWKYLLVSVAGRNYELLSDEGFHEGSFEGF